jgi:hypothetical protein
MSTLAAGQTLDRVYLVLDDFGEIGRAYRETDEARADFKSLLEDLRAGQFHAHPRLSREIDCGLGGTNLRAHQYRIITIAAPDFTRNPLGNPRLVFLCGFSRGCRSWG